MPQKHAIKVSVKNSYYHIYNRGVAKQKIFRGKQDYAVFLRYLKTALSPPPPKNKQAQKIVVVQGTSFKGVPRLPKNFYKEIDLIAYCLMPNHFHLLIKQGRKGTMESFMRSLLTRYSVYFNKKYNRVGPLFQGRYKAVLIGNDRYLLHLSRYIHLNPKEFTDNIIDSYSSYSTYMGLKKTKWVKNQIIKSFFNKKVIPEINKKLSYKGFVENSNNDSIKVLGELTLE